MPAAATSASRACSCTGSGVVRLLDLLHARRHPGPERAERACGEPEAGPDLPGEAGDRGLAVGAGDRGDAARLALEQARRHQRQPAARVGVQDQRHRQRQAGERRVAEHRGGAAREGIVDERPAVGPAARQRREQRAGATARDPALSAGDLDLLPAGAADRQPWIEQARQPHPCSPPAGDTPSSHQAPPRSWAPSGRSGR